MSNPSAKVIVNIMSHFLLQFRGVEEKERVMVHLKAHGISNVTVTVECLWPWIDYQT